MSTTKALKTQYNKELMALALRYGSSKNPRKTCDMKLPRNSTLSRWLNRVLPRGKKAQKYLFQ